jgi:hypothetical protein
VCVVVLRQIHRVDLDRVLRGQDHLEGAKEEHVVPSALICAVNLSNEQVVQDCNLQCIKHIQVIVEQVLVLKDNMALDETP